jgi:hypothetical protein
MKCEKCGKRQSDHEALDHEYRGQDSEVQLRELREYMFNSADGRSPKSIPIAFPARRTLGRDWTS